MEEKLFKRCLRCNRVLKSYDTQKRGYGDICWEKHLIWLKTNSDRLIEVDYEKSTE